MGERKGVQNTQRLELGDVTEQPKLGAQIYIADSGRVFVYQTIKVMKDQQAMYVKSGKFEVIQSLSPDTLWHAVMECLKYGKDWNDIHDITGNAD